MFEIWLDDQQRVHFRLKGTNEDSIILSKTLWTEPGLHFGDIFLVRYDIIRSKYRESWCSQEHPLMKVLN